MKNEHSLNASIENGLEGSKVIAAAKELEFRQSKKKFFDKYSRILKNLTPEKTEPPVSNHNVSQTSTPSKDLNPELKTTKPAEVKSVKEKSQACEHVGDEKKGKIKSKSQQKIVEYSLTNPSSQQIKRNHNQVGSPSSPELKNSPKKNKATDKQVKK